MPIEVAAPVRVFMPTSCSASPRLRVMSSPGRASEPTARIHTTSGLRSTPEARRTFDQLDLGGLHRRGRHHQGRHGQHHAQHQHPRRAPATAQQRPGLPVMPRSPCSRRRRRPASRRCWLSASRAAHARPGGRSRPVVRKPRRTRAVAPTAWPPRGEHVDQHDPVHRDGRRRCGAPIGLVGHQVAVGAGLPPGAAGEAREGRAEVAARVVAADVRRVDPAVDDAPDRAHGPLPRVPGHPAAHDARCAAWSSSVRRLSVVGSPLPRLGSAAGPPAAAVAAARGQHQCQQQGQHGRAAAGSRDRHRAGAGTARRRWVWSWRANSLSCGSRNTLPERRPFPRHLLGGGSSLEH